MRKIALRNSGGNNVAATNPAPVNNTAAATPAANAAATAPATPAAAPTNTTTNNNTIRPAHFSGQKIKSGAINFFGGILVSLVAFIVSYCVLRNYEIHYVLVSVLSLVVAALAIKAWDKATGEVPTPMSGPVTNTLIAALIFSLLIGYQNHKNNSPADDVYFESSTLHHVNEVWFTEKEFKAGSEATVEVSYNDVKLVDGKVLKPGKYKQPIYSDGKLSFIGTKEAPAKIKIIYE